MNASFIRDLGDGLILRHAIPDDTEALVQFNAITHSGSDQPDRHVADHTYDLISGRLPTFQAGDFTIVEDTATGRIVSSLSLISQVWAYDGIPFPVGRPEIVGTAPAYRQRGLVRAQFEEVHRWSQARGELVQVITGNPWYYRQFGYELALTLGGGRVGSGYAIPKLKPGEEEPVTIRPAGEADLPWIARLYDLALQRQPIHCLRDAALWRYELSGRSQWNLNRKNLFIIEDPAWTEPAGFFTLTPWLWGTSIWLSTYELQPGASWLNITPSVLRCLWSAGESYARQDDTTCEIFGLGLGAEHPCYATYPGCWPVVRKPSAWYLRVPDLPAFVRHIAPALEKRLAKTPAAGYSGRVRISFYRNGLLLVLEHGCLTQVEAWPPTQEAWGDAAFPDLTFLQLLFGYRTLEELEYAFADCWVASDQIRAVLNALFPKCPSDIWGIG